MYQPADAELVGSLRCSDEKGEKWGGGVGRKRKLFVIIFIYLAAPPQAAAIWLMIISVPIRSPSHPESFSHRLWSAASLSYCAFRMHQIPARSFNLEFGPKVKNEFLLSACCYFSSNHRAMRAVWLFLSTLRCLGRFTDGEGSHILSGV